MSLPSKDQVQDYEFLRGLAKRYHELLQEEKSFPPLGPDKAMHVLAKALGFKNSHVLKAQLQDLCSQENAGSPSLHQLSFTDCPVFSSAEPMEAVFRTYGEAIWYLYNDYVRERLLSSLDNAFDERLKEMITDMTDLLDRYGLTVPDELHMDADCDPESARETLHTLIAEEALSSWPVEAVVALCDLYFDERDAEDDVVSWYSVRELTVSSPEADDVRSVNCPSRFKS